MEGFARVFGVSTKDADFEGTHAAHFDSSFNSRHYFRCQTKIHNFDQNFHTNTEDTATMDSLQFQTLFIMQNVMVFQRNVRLS